MKFKTTHAKYSQCPVSRSHIHYLDIGWSVSLDGWFKVNIDASNFGGLGRAVIGQIVCVSCLVSIMFCLVVRLHGIRKIVLDINYLVIT